MVRISERWRHRSPRTLLRTVAALALFLVAVVGAQGHLGTTPARAANPTFTAIAPGGSHTCGLSNAGVVTCWGRNDYGQLGDGTTVNSSVPVIVSGLGSGVRAIAAGGRHSCAVTAVGAVKCWGYNQAGQLGNSTTGNSALPVQVTGLIAGAEAVTAGGLHTCALVNGGVKCWGQNDAGQLGIGATVPDFSTEPVNTVGGLDSGVQSISAGGLHSCALTTAGGVRCWGYNADGQVGNGTNVFSVTTPATPIGLVTGVASVRTGAYHSCALLGGGVQCWGQNGRGQLGTGSTIDSNMPVSATASLTSGVLAIALGSYHSCGLTGVGAKCWGENSEGQLGNGTTTNSNLPVAVAGLTGALHGLAAGSRTSCVLTAAGEAKCWGYNFHGQLGNGFAGISSIPVPVSGLSSGVLGIAAGDGYACALLSSGTVKCWGRNASGQLGNATNTDSSLPEEVSNLAGVQAVATGRAHACALTGGGAVKCWGQNGSGQLGNGSVVSSNIPVDVNGLGSGVQAIAAGSDRTCALVTGGAVKCWGQGPLGDGLDDSSNVPVDILALGGMLGVTAGDGFSCAVTGVAGAKCWGVNFSGQLGNGNTDESLSPIDVTGLTGVQALSAGGNHACARAGGGMWCWGRNDRGQLGVGTTTPSSLPLPVNGLSSGVWAVATGFEHTCAVTAGGIVKCWGENGRGLLGNGTTIASFTPVEVSGLGPGNLAVAAGRNATCAITGGGGVKCWGWRQYGQLGDGRFDYSAVPVDVVGEAPSTANPCPGPSSISLTTGATGEVLCRAPISLLAVRAPGDLPPAVSAIFSWDNATQQFKFWFKGFPNSFQTLTMINPGNYYFFQATGIGSLPNTGGGATLAVTGTENIGPTFAGANAAIWSGSPHLLGTLDGYGRISLVTAIFSWDNPGQEFRFWFRGFPDNFQTLSNGIERGKHYFFQAPGGVTILMD